MSGVEVLWTVAICILAVFFLIGVLIFFNRLFVVALAIIIPTTALAPQSPRGAETFAVGASVTLAWDAPERVDGFRLYVRESGQNYITFQDVGTNRVWRVSGLKRKTTYRFVVMAYRSGLESGPSNEVSYRTPFSPSDR